MFSKNLQLGKFMPTEMFTTSEQLGMSIRRARKALKLTQPQVAMAANTGIRFIVDLEAGKPTCQIEKVLRVINVLGGDLAVTWLDE